MHSSFGILELVTGQFGDGEMAPPVCDYGCIFVVEC